MSEGRLGQRVVARVRGILDEVQREEPVANGLREPIERQAATLERLDDADTADVGLGQP
jgi:hypothetical protein